MKLPQNKGYLYLLGNLMTASLTLVGFLLQAISGTADMIQIITSGWSLLTIVAFTLVNLTLVILLSLRKQEIDNSRHISKTEARMAQNLALREEKNKVALYQHAAMGLAALVLLQLGILVFVLLNRPYVPTQYDYEQAVIEIAAAIEDKKAQSDPSYEPMTPPSGVRIDLWEPLRANTTEIGSLPSVFVDWDVHPSVNRISYFASSAQVVSDPSDRDNLAIMLVPRDGEVGFGFNWGQGTDSFVIQLRIKVLAFGAGSLLPDYERWSDGKWHTWEFVSESEQSNVYIDGVQTGETTNLLDVVPVAGLRFSSGDTLLIDDIVIWSVQQ